MASVASLSAAIVIAAAAITGLLRGVDVFSAMSEGAAEGLKTVLRIFPPLVALLTAVHMLRASGAVDALTALASPLLELLGIPPETAVLMLLRPVSGSGAMAAAADIMAAHGPDSLIGRTAAIMLGSTETTFYTISVYFGASRIRKTRYAVPAALIADFTGFFVASLTAKLFF